MLPGLKVRTLRGAAAAAVVGVALALTAPGALARLTVHSGFVVGAAQMDITPTYFPHGASFPSPVPASCLTKTPRGTTASAYFNGVRYFAFEDPYHVDSRVPPG